MRTLATLFSMAAVGLAGCATGSMDPAAVAARECSSFARIEGARLLGVDGVEPMTAGGSEFRVRLRLEDGLSRRMTAECLYSAAGATTRWSVPLPAGFVRV